ncbi:MAG: hypothetical protein AAGA28_05955 [Pseudomonadota bacterium]
MTTIRILTLLAAVGCLGACSELGTKEDKTVDRGYDDKRLLDLRAGIWVDPNGCDHWIIDDGVEGYLSQRLDRHGRPVCSGVAPPNTATGPFREGSDVSGSV